ncbi:hypothetical protein [Solirubrum puertoriconensis]|uniref:Uncharacterized protein n=1 Tax=Solirubrum puertoriconensis TaxID=1751427 RepID=A0A9X0HNL8_SOLP1|nr:hypothetical protein [Solirubrum puertoriconensis]KUG09362.1 hypothetical protein ASU33_16660 [Solirubrum puertoriconensis]
MMKRLIIALLSWHLFAVSLVPAGNALELLKIPQLVDHYQQQHAGSSVLRFLYDHYAGLHNQQRQQDHESLPLHTCLHQATALALPPVLRLALPQPLEFSEAQQYGGEYVVSAPRGVSRTYFQPPRSVAAPVASRA